VVECVTIGRWVCEHCGERFDREKSGARPIRFCGQPCYHDWNRANKVAGGRFAKGNTPWNKDIKGIHLSPHSEWKPGCESHKRSAVGTVTLRHRQREQHRRAFVKIAQPDVWRERAVVVWEQHFGRKVPAGFVVHHKDRDPLNDSIDNLEAMSRADHAREHVNDRKGAA